jgi:hypothetical protein
MHGVPKQLEPIGARAGAKDDRIAADALGVIGSRHVDAEHACSFGEARRPRLAETRDYASNCHEFKAQESAIETHSAHERLEVVARPD